MWPHQPPGVTVRSPGGCCCPLEMSGGLWGLMSGFRCCHFCFVFHSSNLISLTWPSYCSLSLSFPVSLIPLWSRLLCLLSSSQPCKSFLLRLSAYSPFPSTTCFQITLDLGPPENLPVCLSTPGVRWSHNLSRSQEAVQSRKVRIGFYLQNGFSWSWRRRSRKDKGGIIVRWVLLGLR